MYGISLFTGYAGIDLALSEYVRPIIYCEIERYAQGIILSRMDDGTIPFAPIWNDVTTLDGKKFRGLVDIIYGGFPCQDLSVAGKGAGLAGKRSGLFREIIRLAQEASPTFIFLENVPAIRTRGSIQVQEALASIGYDTRWGTLSASEVGANHKRERWFCLAKRRDVSNTMCDRGRLQQISRRKFKDTTNINNDGKTQSMANTVCKRQQRQGESFDSCNKEKDREGQAGDVVYGGFPEQWKTEPSVGRVVDGYPTRSHELKALGNGVVPLQVKKAFETLMGIK